jgi:hypothetical protein
MSNWLFNSDGTTIIIFDPATQAAAFKAAEEVAEKTGRTVTIRNQKWRIDRNC